MDKVIFDNQKKDNGLDNNPRPSDQPSVSPPKPPEEIKPIGEKVIDSQEVLNPSIEELIRRYQENLLAKRKGEFATIHVDEIASKIAIIYERIRKIVDWKEENVLRRSAILRILKRSFISKISPLGIVFQTKANQVAEPLVLELIRGGHLPNDEISEGKIAEVAAVLEKYVFLLENAPFETVTNYVILKTKVNFYNFILEIAAAEIEDVLAPPLKENDLIRAMTHILSDRIRVVPENAISPRDKETQTYIATCRTLFDLDDPLIAYHILKYQYPEWLKAKGDTLQQFTQNIFNIINHIEGELTHPQRKEFMNICERVDTVFTILGDLLDYYQKEPEKIYPVIANREKLKELITKFYEKRYKTLKTRLFRLAILTSASVFLSNSFTFFLIEVPLAKLFYEGFNLFTALIDFLVPTILMFLMVTIIKPPPPQNLEELIKLTYQFIYLDSEKKLYEIKVKKRRRLITNLVISILYISACLLTFYFVGWVFYKARLPITSVIFDTVMIAINVFAAVTIRNKSKEITVLEKTSFWEFALDVLSVPVAKVGSFLAAKWKEYNVFTVFFNFIIEVPFVTFVEFIESWSTFLKEKKAEIH